MPNICIDYLLVFINGIFLFAETFQFFLKKINTTPYFSVLTFIIMAHRFFPTKETIRQFIYDELRYVNYQQECDESIINLIWKNEIGIINIKNYQQTLHSADNRDGDYADDRLRWDLRSRIIDELLTTQRLENDDQIKLGNGGALPNCEVQKNRQAFIVIGLPASGKSTICNYIADDHGAIILDSDYCKRKLPEYYSDDIGSANLVHEESSAITFGFEQNDYKLLSLFERCTKEGLNIVVPKIGNSPKKILELSEALRTNKGYDIHLILTELIKRDATIRAIKRLKSTGRYIPLGLIWDEYGNDPLLCYYYLRCHHPHIFKTLYSINTDVEFGSSPICTDKHGEPHPITKYKNEKKMIF